MVPLSVYGWSIMAMVGSLFINNIFEIAHGVMLLKIVDAPTFQLQIPLFSTAAGFSFVLQYTFVTCLCWILVMAYHVRKKLR